MKSSWKVEKGHLVSHWSEDRMKVPSHPAWMDQMKDIQGSYLPPLPDFADHSPFGGATWFERYFMKKHLNRAE